MSKIACRGVVLALSLGSSVAVSAAPVSESEERAEPRDAAAQPAAARLPLPKDAAAPSDAPGGGGKIQVYQVPRGRDAVVAEVRELLKAGKWTITKDDPSPSGRAIRIEVKNGDALYKVSFTGDATRTAIIVTLP
jgi:hypothetical protein